MKTIKWKERERNGQLVSHIESRRTGQYWRAAENKM
jgi:hypothetical protein